MRSHLMFAALVGAIAVSQPSFGQERPDAGIRTETQERRLAQGQNEFPWDLVGLVGLLGLLGFSRGHAEDGYHPAPVE